MAIDSASISLRTRLGLGAVTVLLTVITTMVTTSFTVGREVTEAENQRNRNTEEIAQLKKLNEERDHRSDEMLRFVTSAVAELKAQMALVLQKVFPPGKLSYWQHDDGIFTSELISNQPKAEMAPFQIKPKDNPLPTKDRLIELEHLRQKIIEVRSKVESLQLFEKGYDVNHFDMAKIEQRRALEIQYEKLKIQEVILSREILGSI